MTRIRIRTPSRLHFGLLGWGPRSPRQFGGVGLMIEAPGIELEAEPARGWQAEGPLAGRVREVAERVARRITPPGYPPVGARFRIGRSPREHVGLGVGTQLSLAVARSVATLAGFPDLPAATLAPLCERGRRSGIGIHGFERGGLIVDGGRGAAGGPPPLLVRQEFPPDWGILVILPGRSSGLHGRAEVDAFEQLPPVPSRVTDRLCRLVLLELLPAVVERDLERFGAALADLQQQVGRCFAPAQGGIYARPELAGLAAILESEGLSGIGQSSWGPTLYGFSAAPEDRRAEILARIREHRDFDGPDAFWTVASPRGAVVSIESLEAQH